MDRAALAFLGAAAALVWFATPLPAQGVTGAAIGGRVLGADSTPVEQATVRVVNGSNGERWQTTTNARGRYFIEHLSIGGPYRIEVRAVGYHPTQRESLLLALGQRLTADFVLTQAMVELEQITVIADQAPLGAGRTGPAQVISDSLIARLPVRGRDYTELARLSPQVTKSPNGGLSFTGQHDRYTSIQIDGTSNNDPFGSFESGNGTPGWAVGLNAFTPEAVKELQVVSAPFDVRYGNFAGGLINAVTRSGTNRVEGSILGSIENTDLSGTDWTGSRGEEFDHKEFGLTLGAPIVRDRVALFVNAAVRRQVVPQSVPAPTSETTVEEDLNGAGISYESMVRFQDLLRLGGADPGTSSAGSYSTPSRNLFAKVTAQLAVNSRLEISHNYGHGNDRHLIGDREPGSYSFSSSGYQIPETVNSTRLAWTTAFGSQYSNELVLARVDDRRTCIPTSGFPTVSVSADKGTLIAGVFENCLGVETGSTIWELTDNFGVAAGSHHFTFGTHGELIDLVDDAAFNPIGSWSFDDLDALARGEASFYSRDMSAEGAQVAFRAEQIGAYVQDQWVATRLIVTAGLRLDVPLVPTPPELNRAVLDSFGISTTQTPSGNILWSPRLGVNYDVSGRGTFTLRGGVGLFGGRPAYQWFRNVYARNASLPFRIDCEGERVPQFTLDPASQPRACDDEETPGPGRYNYFDPEFRFPQNLKVAVGADFQFSGGVVGTLDFLYTRGVNTFEMRDVNLFHPAGVAAGEGGRAMYGDIDPATGEAAPSRLKPELDALFELRNGGGGDRAYSVTAQLEKRLANGTGLSVAYTYTNAKDRVSSEADEPGPNVALSVLNGTLEHRELRTSAWEVPHKLTLVGTTNLPLGVRLGLVYIGGSGASYTWVVQGDANADGFWGLSDASNDVVYVPRYPADMSLANPAQFAALDRLIRDEPCLRSQRGRLLQRNSCRDPWVHETQARWRSDSNSRPAEDSR